MDPALLEVLCCPVSRQRLRVADQEFLSRVSVSPPLEGALIREDGKMLYRVVNGIPVLLPEEGIAI